MEAFGAAQFEGVIYCKFCFEKGGFARKQTQVKWVPKASTGASAAGAKFGGGGQSCTSCGKTVYPGELVQYDLKPYHSACMRCSECSKETTMSNVAQFEGKLFCLRCFEKGGYARKQAAVKFVAKTTTAPASGRFATLGGGGNKCYTCQTTVYPAETLMFEQRPYHQKCFKCLNCKKEMTVNQAEHKGDKVYCQKCFMALGLHMATLDPPGGKKGGDTPSSPVAAASPVSSPVATQQAAASPEPEPEAEAAAPATLSPEEEIALLKKKLAEAESKLA